MNLQCDFCGSKFKLPPEGRVSLDQNWNPSEESAAQLASRTRPKGTVESRPETDDSLLLALKQAEKTPERWKGTIHVSWTGAGLGLALGVAAAYAIQLTGLGQLWQFEDESGSPLYFIVPIGLVIAGMLMGARDVGPVLLRQKLEALIKRYDLDTARMLQVAKQNRRHAAAKAIEEMYLRR